MNYTDTAPTAHQLTHDALFYNTDTDLIAALIPFLRQGMENGDALICAVTRSNIDVLRQDLGGDAEHVNFIDRDQWYSRPAVTITGWQRLLHQALAAGNPFVRIVGEVAFGEPVRHPTWTRYESVINELFATAPAWIVCPYHTETLHPQVLADARRTHPGVFDPVRRPSDGYTPTAELLTAIAERFPPLAGALAVDMAIGDDPTALAGIRQTVTDAAVRAGAGSRTLEDLQLVVTELAGNSLRHGSGRRWLRLWTSPDMVTGEITDEGSGITDPLAGYQSPPIGTPGGRGIWISRQLCDHFAITHDAETTRVHFRISG